MVRSIVQKLNEMHRYQSLSLEETLYESLKDKLDQRNKEYQVGDVVFSKYYSSRSSGTVNPHPIMIITSVEKNNGYVQYEGLPLKSDDKGKNKSNKYPEGFPNSISINDYSTILVPGDKDAQYPVNKQSYIDVQDLARFRSYDMSNTRYAYAGHVTDEFYKFAMSARNRYLRHEDNRNIHWEK